jgi:hypothetical protein
MSSCPFTLPAEVVAELCDLTPSGLRAWASSAEFSNVLRPLVAGDLVLDSGLLATIRPQDLLNGSVVRTQAAQIVLAVVGLRRRTRGFANNVVDGLSADIRYVVYGLHRALQQPQTAKEG